MKKSILLLAAVYFTAFTFAQSDKYVNAMKSNITQLDSIFQKNNSAELSNNFIRIGDAEKTHWLPYYYAAYCTVIQAYNGQDNSQKDVIADKANELISKAESLLGKENSETYVIKSMIATAHLMVDLQTRYMTYGPASSEWIKKAEKLDATNPRPVLLEAQSKFYTPEAFGGGKDAAKILFEKAARMFETFKPETELSPVWGRASLNYFLSQYK
ncbi:MAG: hypothetical protein ABIR03_00020 [Ginsengibacter sp.]